MSNNRMLKIPVNTDQNASNLISMLEDEKIFIIHELDRKLYYILQKKGPRTRSELVSITGNARSTIYDSLERLRVKGYIRSFSEKRMKKGRPKTYFAVKDY
ncbi:MAG: helix-turn-helix domain-containing protein [Candidatus Hodarchaeota archaeon]